MIRFTIWFLAACVAIDSSAQTFDECYDLWPVQLKIGGTVVASGGLTLPDRTVDYFVKSAQKSGANPILIQLGTPPVPDAIRDVDSLQFIQLNSPKHVIDSGQLVRIEESAAVCFLADGKSGFESESLMKVLEQVVQGGGLLCVNGSLSEMLGRFRFEEIVDVAIADYRPVWQGQNLIFDSIIRTGYSDQKDRQSLLSVLASNPRCVGIGIPADSAIVLRGRKIRVQGESDVTFCLMANEHQPLRIKHVPEATSTRSNPYETIVDLTAWRRDAIDRTVTPFPPQQPPTPFVENGTLVIVGGGGTPSGLMERMVEWAGGKDAKLVYVPCSERESVGDRHRIVETWKQLGVQDATFVHTKDRQRANQDPEFLEPLKDATGIWFGGGRQWNFADSYYGTEAHRLMKNVLSRGGVIGGSSAGASIQARYMCRANPVANFDIMAPGYERGLGFIGGVAIDQHFSQRRRQKDMTQLVDRYPQLLGIGIDEATALVVRKSQGKVVGRGKVHFYDRNRTDHPAGNDSLALEEGAVFDLATRRIVTSENSQQNTR